MKKTFIFTMLLILSATSFSQQTNTKNPVTKADYLQKSKNQKAGGWVLLGGGALVLTITAVSSAGVDFQNRKSFPVVPVSLGAAIMAGSVPLFLASGRNKRKGMSLAFKNETGPLLLRRSFTYKNIPSLTLKISL